MSNIIDLFSSDIKIGEFCKIDLITGKTIVGKVLEINESVLIELEDGKKIRILSSIIGAWEILSKSPQSSSIAENNSMTPLQPNTVETISSSIGLIAISAPNNDLSDFPSFFSFNNTTPVTHVGSDNDISLGKWDCQSKKKGLYKDHVLFEYHPYPISRWSIRSTHGFRRDSKVVMVNESIISSQNGDVFIKNGDIIALGGFTFEFKTTRKEELLNYETPEVLTKYLEIILKTQVEKFRKEDIPDTLFNTNRMPGPIFVKKKTDGSTKWIVAYIGDYKEMLLANWGKEIMKGFREEFNSMDNFENMMKRIRKIRNILDHPKEAAAPINGSDRQLLVDFYLKLLKATSSEDLLYETQM